MAQYGNASLCVETMASRPKGERERFFSRSGTRGAASMAGGGYAPMCRSWSGATPRAGAGSKRVDAGGEAGEFARNRVLVQHALGDRPMQLRLGNLKSRLSRLLIAGLDRGLDLFDEGAHPAHPGPIDRRALLGLANALFRRFVGGHASSPKNEPVFYKQAAAASTPNGRGRHELSPNQILMRGLAGRKPPTDLLLLRAAQV